jgi:hypothetical protein
MTSRDTTLRNRRVAAPNFDRIYGTGEDLQEEDFVKERKKERKRKKK